MTFLATSSTSGNLYRPNAGGVLPFTIPADGTWRGRGLEDGGERSGDTAFAVGPAM